MNKETEIELTFLAAELPKEIKASAPLCIVDTYIPEKHDFSPLRIRKRGNVHELTRKMPIKKDDYSAHEEITIPLEEDVYIDMLRLSKKSVTKDRYVVKIDDYYAHVDVFKERLQGLVLIEFEFKSKEEIDGFEVPNSCLVDVTQDRTILGGQIAGKSYEDIEPWLKSKGYKKL
ncbi:hypothetical protein KC959_00105 [Candidatus Saccharibacteria bacterium]|nr:hypothetical protein [Candidatus Saccharibacteria bacterium]